MTMSAAPALSHILNVADARRGAARRLPRALFEYVDRGTEDEVSMATTRHQLDAVKLSPSVLVDVSDCRTSANILGWTQALPLVIAPTAVAGLMWHDGEIALAKAAAAAGIPFCVSTLSITPIERIAAESGARLWFQLYVWKNRQRSFALLDRAWAAGAKTLVLTVDTAVSPNREYNPRNGFGVPLKPSWRIGLDVARHPRWAASVMLRALTAGGVPAYAHYPEEFRTQIGLTAGSDEISLASDVTWEDVKLLRRHWRGKFVIKGVLRVDDALTALAHGVDAIVVSNHGARNLDCIPGPVEILPAIADAVAGRLEILADSGVRRGADIARYLALGARGVLVGRAPLYGAAIGGAAGAGRVLDILAAELRTTMALLGARSTADFRLASDITRQARTVGTYPMPVP
jgi:L-lactate dehydrogenase (cytochrome)